MKKREGNRKGVKLSAETKEKMRIAHIGKVYSIESRLKMRLSHLGKKNPHKGIVQSIESRRKKSEALKGDKSHFWKGGKTEESKLIRSSMGYKIWREFVFKRDNWTCVLCKKIGGRLNADHIKPFCDYPDLRFNVDNGRTLCVDCHKKTPTYGRRKKLVGDYYLIKEQK